MCSTRRRITRRCVYIYTMCMYNMFGAHNANSRAHTRRRRSLLVRSRSPRDGVDILKYAFKIFTSVPARPPQPSYIQSHYIYTPTYTHHTLSTRILMYVYSKTFPHTHTHTLPQQSEIPQRARVCAFSFRPVFAVWRIILHASNDSAYIILYVIHTPTRTHIHIYIQRCSYSKTNPKFIGGGTSRKTLIRRRGK